MTSTLFLEILLSLSLQATLVVAATHWIGRLADDERTQSRLWTGCYALLLLLVFTASLFPHMRLFQPLRPISRPLVAEIVVLELQAGRILLVVWLSGCAISTCLFIYRSVQAMKFLRTCHRVDPNVISLGDVVSGTGHNEALPTVDGQPVQLVSSPSITSPFCWQFHRPFIVLPQCLLTCDDDKLKFILRHELAHLRTGHPIQVFLQRGVEIIFWFHPMVWWASHESALAREFMCDDEAVETQSEIVDYLKTLLAIAERNVATEEPRVGSLAFLRNRNVMAERARRLVRAAQKHPVSQRSPKKRRLCAAAAPALLAGTALVSSVFWLPINLLASPESRWSPWPRWSASVLHDFGVQTRDFEVYDPRCTLHELLADDQQSFLPATPPSPAL
jgi:bla regulator protein blaR1